MFRFESLKVNHEGRTNFKYNKILTYRQDHVDLFRNFTFKIILSQTYGKYKHIFKIKL